ncbi:CBS domain-containing protein [Salix suchowensis]|nr:CBS domain-containing protein [Salix suchowensis]
MSSQMGPPPPKRTSLTQKRGQSTARKLSSSSASLASENGGTTTTNTSQIGNISKPSSPNAPSSVGGERTVKKLKLSKALTIPEGTTVFDACRRMAARRVNAVLLTDANALLSGIVTDKDISARVIAEGLRPEQTVVSKVMTRNPIFVTSDSLAIEALQKMVQGKFRHLPVVENGEVIALLDITKCLYDAISRMEKAAEQGSAIAAAVEGVERQWGNNFTAPYAFIETLRERMFKPALSTIIGEQSKVAIVSPSDPVFAAAKKMRELRVNSVIVVNGDKIHGILTSKDILMRVVAQNLSPELTLVEKVMTLNPECVTLETTILDALHVMHDGKFLHLPVVDKDGSVAACLDVLQITHAAISMVESSSGAVNDVANTMMQKFWDSALALEPPDDCDTQSEMSALMASDATELGRYPSLGLGNSFAFKFEDLKGRVHRLNCGTENLNELLSTVFQRIGADNEQDRPQLLYEDDEGDKVLLATDGDLISAVNHARSGGLKVLRLHLDYYDPSHQTKSSPSITTTTTTQRAGLVSHRSGILAAGVVLGGIAVVVYLKRAKQ